jgi:hypothetical protein
MLFLEHQWPENLPYFLDFQETQVTCPINVITQLVKAEPKRLGLVLSNNATTTIGVSTNPNTAPSAGFQFTTNQQNIVFIGPGLELLAAQPWFLHAGATQIVIAVFQITCNRPSSRPVLPGQLLPRYEEKPKTVDIFADMLKRQRKWRKKVYRYLQGSNFNGPRSHPAGAGLADALGSRLRYLQGDNSALSAEE